MKGHKGTLRGVRYVCYLDCGYGVMGACICPDSSHRTHLTCAVLCISLYLYKAVKNTFFVCFNYVKHLWL